MLQRSEFSAMMMELSPQLVPSVIDSLWQTCGGSGQYGSINEAALEVCLFEYEMRAAQMRRARKSVEEAPRGSGGAAAGGSSPDRRSDEEARAQREMEVMSRLWDDVKDGAERVERIDDLLGIWHIIVRMQASVRRAKVKSRLREQQGGHGAGSL